MNYKIREVIEETKMCGIVGVINEQKSLDNAFNMLKSIEYR